MVLQNDLNAVRNCRRSLLHLTMLTSIVATAAALSHHSPETNGENVGSFVNPNRHAAISYCNEAQERTAGRRLLYVTTLDGRLSALDIKNNGKLAWSIQTGPGALISSSIHRLELTNNGQFVRMIPSLSGGIYKFDGETIDPIPITTDNLLSSSAKFSDDLVISGGKETRTYGVSAGTGELLYECSMHGCINSTDALFNETAASNETEDSNNNDDDDGENGKGYMRKHDILDDIIVVRRQTQTVRAVETRTGMERWNFSVGQHELNLVKSEECHDRPFNDLDLAILDMDVKVIVPEGIICAFSKTDTSVMLWKHKFDHPIVSAWKIGADDELETIDLFGSAQWLWDQDKNVFNLPYPTINPSIYLGMYEKQLYIQESINLRREIDDKSNLYNHLTAVESNLPKIPWRPVAASSNSLVIFNDDKIIREENNNVGAGAAATEVKGNELMPYDEENFAVSAQSVLNASEYVNGNGFYLFVDKQTGNIKDESMCEETTANRLPAIEDAGNGEQLHSANITNITNNPFEDLGFSLDDTDAPVKVVILSLWFWWREITVIAITTAILVHFLIGQRYPPEREIVVIERHIPVATETATEAIIYHNSNKSSTPGSNHSNQNPLQSCQRTISESTTHSGEHFTSRFQGDFDLIRCLGRGGFGVVFEAKNKLDDCKYAVKRITLPNKKESRDRVLREVKTLANCEHQNIVRYFQAWVEAPPPGWQEDEDNKWLAHEMSTSIQIETPDGSTLPSSFGNGLQQSPKTQGKLQVEKKKQLLSWVSSVTSTSCSSEGGDAIAEVDEDEEDDSLIVFRTESQSQALRDEGDDNDDNAKTQPIVHEAKTEAIAIDIHSDSIDLKYHNGTPNGRIDYSQLSDSFQIEFVRSTNGNTDNDDDDCEEQQCSDGTTTKRNSTSKSTTTTSTAKTNSKSNSKLRPQTLNLLGSGINKEQNNNSSECKALLPVMNGGMVNGITPPTPPKPPQNKVYLYIQMQLCRKESLRDWLREHKTDAREPHIGDIFHQIVDAVDYVHLKGLIHRDLKPSNIFFSQDGQIKIGDFGLVTDMSDIPNIVTQCGDKTGLPSCHRHTQQVGTHLYMSPEQLRGQHYDYKVDIYSLGLIFFELLVYFGTEMERIVTLRTLRDGQYPKQFPLDYPREYDLLKLMLSAQPDMRPPTSELKQQLHGILKLPENIGDISSYIFIPEARRYSVSRTRTLSFND